jgi:hypothetical protein
VPVLGVISWFPNASDPTRAVPSLDALYAPVLGGLAQHAIRFWFVGFVSNFETHEISSTINPMYYG